MNYCSNCGSQNLIQQVPSSDIHTRVICQDCQVVHYSNPKIVTGCLVFHEGKVLLCKRAIAPQKGFWNFPAGFMENKETLQEGAKREVREEVNATVIIKKLHTVYNIMHVDQVYFLFLAELVDGKYSVGEETADVKLFDLEDIPWEQLAFQSNIFALRQYIANPNYEGVHHGDNHAYLRELKA